MKPLLTAIAVAATAATITLIAFGLADAAYLGV